MVPKFLFQNMLADVSTSTDEEPEDTGSPVTSPISLGDLQHTDGKCELWKSPL